MLEGSHLQGQGHRAQVRDRRVLCFSNCVVAADVLSLRLDLVSLQQPGTADSVEREAGSSARGETTAFLASSLTVKFASCFGESRQEKMDAFGLNLKISC